MVEQDTGAAEHTVGFVILFCNHKAILLVYCIRTVGVKMWCFILKNLFKFAEQFGRGGPADAEGASQTGDAYKIPEHAGLLRHQYWL